MRFPLTTRPAELKANEAGRSCGECTACCVLPRIRKDVGEDKLPEGKRGYTPCPYLTTERYDTNHAGCSCYSDRPKVCREFACLWRAGFLSGDERRRPDQLGVMFTVEECRGKIVIEAWELWDGALRDHPGRGVLESLTGGDGKHAVTVLCRWYGVPASIQYRGPESLIRGAELARWAREEPQRLADWLEWQTAAGNLDDVDHELYRQDLDRLRAGEGVKPWFQPGGVR